MRTKIKSNICTLIIVAIVMFLFRSYYITYASNVRLEFESIDNGLEYQIYYTEKENEEFSEVKMVTYNTTKHDEYSDNSINLGQIKYIQTLKIKVKNDAGDIKFRNLRITDGEKEKIIPENQLINSKVDETFLKEVTLKFEPKNIMKINYLVLANIFFVVYLFVYAITAWIIKRKFSVRELAMCMFIMVFLVLIILPSLHIDSNEIDSAENRALNKPPTFEEIKNLEVKKIENWYNDHFGFRDKYIEIKDVIYNQKKFSIPFLAADIRNKEESGIGFKGKDNWFWFSGDNSIINYTNIERYKEEELKLIETNLDSAYSYFENKGIKLYFYIAPDKNQIYPEYYPDYIVRQSDYSKTDQLVEYINNSKEKFKIIYPKKRMISVKKQNQDLMYWKADTHWNQYGAYIGYQELMENIKKDYPELSILTEDDFKISYHSKSEGDLSRKKSVRNEKYRGYKIKDALSFEYVKNNGTEGITTKNKNKDLNMVMFRDSFTISLLPYLSSSFNNCEYIWSSDIKSNLSVIETNKPDIVIIEVVERYTKPVNLFDKFDMKGVN